MKGRGNFFFDIIGVDFIKSRNGEKEGCFVAILYVDRFRKGE